MRIVVTGSSGCIGSALVPKLRAAGHEVAEVDVVAGGTLPDDGAYDVFCNLAWQGSRGERRADYALQLGMVKTALDYYNLAIRLGCRRFLCPGTVGELMAELPECSGIRAQNLVYINAKSTLRRMLRAIERPERCRAVWARLGNIYGPGDTGNLVNWTLGRLRAGEAASFGPADQPYDFVAMDDAARALSALCCAESLGRDEYYVGAGEPRPLCEFLREVGRIAGREDLIVIGGRPDDGTRYRSEWFNIAPLAADTGYRPRTAFADGVRALAESMGMEVAG